MGNCGILPMEVQRKGASSPSGKTQSLVTMIRGRTDRQTCWGLVSPWCGCHPHRARTATSCEVTDRLPDVMHWARGVLRFEQA